VTRGQTGVTDRYYRERKERVGTNEEHVEDDDNNNNDDDDDDDDNYDNKKDNDGRVIRDFSISNASRREKATRRRLKYMWKSERRRKKSLMKECVGQVQISAHTGVIHAIIIALSKRASNNALP